MSTPPRTIDNLGVDTSTRWARDQNLLATSPIKEGGTITHLAEIDVTQPFYSSEFELLFGEISQRIPWAEFLAPKGFNEQKKRLFTYQIMPILGSVERLEAQMNRVKTHKQHRKPIKQQKEDSEQKESEQEELALPWEATKEEEEEEKEKKILLMLMDALHMLNRFLVDINSRRIQYQKG